MIFRKSQLDTLAEIVAEAAAAEIMPRFRALEAGGIREKSSALDLVTDADEKAEWRIRDVVARAFPRALFVGEESVARDASLLAKIGDADLAVIVDPVDGTGNFAWGLPLFGVLAAVTVRGEMAAGLIYDPVCRDWRMALRGEGAWAQAPGGSTRDLKSAAPVDLADMIGIAGWHLMPEPLRSRVAANLARTKASFAYRTAAYEYRLLADGLIHYAIFQNVMPWDHAAGVLIHAEAGGFAATYDGAPYRATRHDGGLVCTPDRDSWRMIREQVLA